MLIPFLPDSPYTKAIDWFISGVGQYVPMNYDDNDCISDKFTTPFSLLTLAYSLNLNIPSWYDSSKVISSIADICTHFHSLSCNDQKTSVTRLHLSNTMNGTSGTIPPEVSALTSL